jgi:hypothetical protein
VRLGGLQIYKNYDQIVSTVMMSVTVVVREISRNVFPIKCVLQCITVFTQLGGGHRIRSLLTSLLPEIDKRDLSRTKF